jgi:hypothetical protein
VIDEVGCLSWSRQANNIVVDACPGLRLKATASLKSRAYRYKSPVNAKMRQVRSANFCSRRLHRQGADFYDVLFSIALLYLKISNAVFLVKIFSPA